MRHLTLERNVIAGLEWSTHEITDNDLDHARCLKVSSFRSARFEILLTAAVTMDLSLIRLAVRLFAS